MIHQLKNHLAQNQLETILQIMISQYKKYCSLIKTAEFKNIFVEEYAPHKKMHGASWAIASGFRSNTNVIDGMSITCMKYGRGHSRPELSNDRIIIHILNHTTHFDADYLTKYYRKNIFIEESEQLYCYIKVVIDHRKLKKVSLCLPKSDGNIIAEEVLIDTPEMIILSA